MKNIFKIASIALASALVFSCEMPEFSHDEYSTSQAFGSVENVERALSGLYGELPKVTATYGSETGEVDYFMSELNERFVKGYGPLNVATWSGWSGIRDINYFINTVSDKELCPIDQAAKDNFIGIAKFLRAKKYFTLLASYGDIPWYDAVIVGTDKDNLYKARESRDVIVKHIIEDLDDAAAKITNESVDKSTPDKWCALLLKSRVCLFEASFRKYHNLTASTTTKETFKNYTVEDLYKLAADAADEIMVNGPYKLNKAAGTNGAYRDLFTSDALNQTEVLLGAVTEPGTAIQGSQNNYFNQGSSLRSFVRPFINTYLMKDGSRFTDKEGYEKMSFIDEFKDRDPRLAQTVRGPQYQMIKTVGGSVKENAVPDIKSMAAPLGYQVIKFTLDKTLYDGEVQGNLNSNSTPLYRYAEVLLNYAEAKAELGAKSSEYWSKTIGALRERAGVASTEPANADDYLTKTFYPGITDKYLLEIRRERAIELCLEGQRTLDWKRWAIGANIANLPWTGLHIENINTAIDINGDGVNDYYFSVEDPGGEFSNIWVKIQSGSEEGLYATANAKGGYDLEYKMSATKRNWEDKLYLTPLADSEIAKYKANGYELKQNPEY